MCGCSCCPHRTFTSSRSRNVGLGSMGEVEGSPGGKRRAGAGAGVGGGEGGGVVFTRSVGFGVPEEEEEKAAGEPSSPKGESSRLQVAPHLLLPVITTNLPLPAPTPTPPPSSNTPSAPSFISSSTPTPNTLLPTSPAPTAATSPGSPPPGHRPLRAQASDASLDFADMMRSLGPPPPSAGPRASASPSRQESGTSTTHGSRRSGLAGLWPSSS